MKVRANSILNSQSPDGLNNRNISPGKLYSVIGFDDENYRVINDIGEPILYSKALFELIDPAYSKNWVRVDYEDGEYHVNPPEFSAPGFYEDFFDGVEYAVTSFKNYMNSV